MPSIQYCQDEVSIADAVQRAGNAGILLISIAGNTALSCSGHPPGSSGVTFPGRYSSVLAVSGTTEDDGFWSGPKAPCGQAGSRFGPQVELAAPFWSHGMVGNGSYGFLCGTSFSAPVVTGVAALVWTKFPTWTASQVWARLKASAVDLPPSGHDNKFGYGRVSAVTAVADVPPSYSTNIAGPVGIKPYAQGCYWQVTSSVPNHSIYSWSVGEQVIGSEQQVAYTAGSNFTLTVVVMNEQGQGHSVALPVGVDEGYAECFEY